MIDGADDKFVTPLNGRIPILLSDDDGDSHIHALCLAPEGMSLENGRKAITDAFQSARKEEDWNYDDITDILTKQGFQCVTVALWIEEDDGWDGIEREEEDEDEEDSDPGPPSPLNPRNPK